MQIKYVMTREVIVVPEDASITSVANLLMKHKIHAVPVVDKEQKVLGIVTETDFFLKDSIALYLPAYVEILEREMRGKKRQLEEVPELKNLVNARAKDIMTRNCVTLSEVADVKDLLALVKIHHYKSFPVTDFRGVLIGIVTLIDVIGVFHQEENNNKQ